jgi:hypothetical protein
MENTWQVMLGSPAAAGAVDWRRAIQLKAVKAVAGMEVAGI